MYLYSILYVLHLTGAVCCRLSRDSVHLRHHECGGDARGRTLLQRGQHRVLHVRLQPSGPRRSQPQLGARRRPRRPRLGVGRLLRQHRLRLQVLQRVRGLGRARQDPEGEDELTQQRSGKSGEKTIVLYRNTEECKPLSFYT